jgi:hypothetical protein
MTACGYCYRCGGLTGLYDADAEKWDCGCNKPCVTIQLQSHDDTPTVFIKPFVRTCDPKTWGQSRRNHKRTNKRRRMQ